MRGNRKKFGMFLSILLIGALLSGCVSTTRAVQFNMEAQLQDGEQLYIRFADGTTATSAGQADQDEIVISNPERKQIVGGFITDGTMSWVGNYSYGYSNNSANVSSISEGKPDFAASYVQQDAAVPYSDASSFDGYSVTFTVYGEQEGEMLPVTGRTEVFVEAEGAVFLDMDPKSGNGEKDTADGGMSSYTTNGQVTFVIRPPVETSIKDLKLRVWSGPKLLYTDDAADLMGLELSTGSLEEAFQPDVTEYKAEVPYSTTRVSVTAAVYSPDASLTIGEAAAASGAPSGEIPLKVGENLIPVAVALPDGTTKTYTVNVHRQSLMKGLGTEQQPYLITDAEQLSRMNRYLNQPDVYFRLAADIDLEGYNGQSFWKPIGTGEAPFQGHLDGGGFTISNLTVAPYEVTGLFGYLGEHAEIRDVKLTGVQVNSINGLGGALAGVNAGTITDSMADGSVTSNTRAGGLVGYNSAEAVIQRSSSSIDIWGNDGAGGLVAVNNGRIEQSWSTGKVKSNNAAGGLVGENTGAIMNSYTFTDVMGIDVGSIAGYNNGTIETSYAGGSVTASGDRGRAAGIAVSSGYGNDTVESSFYDAEVAVNALASSYGRTTEEMKSAALYTEAGWDLAEVWTMDSAVNEGYPALRPAVSHVLYKAGGADSGTVPSDSNDYTSGSNAEIADNTGKLAKEGYRFNGWNTDEGGNGMHLAPGAEVKVGVSGLVLYAEWVLDQTPELLAATAGESGVALEWSKVPYATGYEVYRSTESGHYELPVHTADATVDRWTDTGVTNGTTYYYVIKAISPGGDSENSNEKSATPVKSEEPGNPGGEPANPGNNTGNPGGDTGNPGGNEAGSPSVSTPAPSAGTPTAAPVTAAPVTAAPSTAAIELQVNGKTVQGVTVSSTEAGGRKTMKVAISTAGAQSLLAAAETGDVITIPVAGGADAVIQQLSGSFLKGLAEKKLTLKLQTPEASFSLPAQKLDLASLLKKLGAASVEELTLEIEVASPASEGLSLADKAAARYGFSLVGSPVEFTVRGTSGGQSATVASFNAYLERTLEIPNGIHPSRIATAVVVEPNGSVRQVPTKLVEIGGKYQAVIQSRTNSLYALIENKAAFTDMEGHWAKSSVIDMASRLVVGGEGDGSFRPNREVTRVEFAAMVVRGLGIKPEDISGSPAYPDVTPNHWYYETVVSASRAGLIHGMEDGKFHPNDKITREQAMVILAQAMDLTGLSADSHAVAGLQAYTDASSVSAWAKEAAAKNIGAGVISGRSASKLAPQAAMTRAEAAAIIRKLLVQSGLI